MSSKKKTTPEDLSDQPLVDKFRMRGRLFVLEEVDAGTYTDMLDDFTQTNEQTGQEILDEDGFIRALTVKALKEPKWSASQLAAKGQRLVRTLEARVRTLHLSAEPVDTEGLEPEVEEDGEGNGA